MPMQCCSAMVSKWVENRSRTTQQVTSLRTQSIIDTFKKISFDA